MPVGFVCTPTTADLMGFFYLMKNTGQILRSRKNGKSKYTAINNDILQSATLTAQEKSILVHLLSLPEDWIVYKGLIWKSMNMGREQFNKHWKGLIEKGYIVSIRMIDKDTNLVVGWNHVVYEEPVLVEDRTDQSSDLLDFGQSEDPYLNKVDIEQSTNETKERVDKEKPKPKKGFVPPTIEEVSSKFPEINAERFVNYYESIGWKVGKNKMESWVAAAAGWISRDKPQTNVKFEIKNKATLNDD